MPRESAAQVVTEVRRALEAVADPVRAVEAKRYLKSELVFLGANLPDIRREAKALVQARPDLDHDQLVSIAAALWATGVHELRSVAIAVLELRVRLLGPTDAPFLLDLVRTSKTWAYVDWLATKVLGPLVAKHAELGPVIDRAATDEDFWIRRTALLVFHDPLARGGGDFDHFARLAVPMLGETEFFIRKAIGWVLRTTVRRGPEKTIAFVTAHARAMSDLTFREATRNLPAKDQARLLRLRG